MYRVTSRRIKVEVGRLAVRSPSPMIGCGLWPGQVHLYVSTERLSDRLDISGIHDAARNSARNTGQAIIRKDPGK